MMARPISALAVIPARSGSRRVPRKNIRELAGRPAIAYTIEAALEADVFEDVVVSTDSDEIASIARAYGARVPFLRAATLADDRTPVSAVTLDALARVDPEGRHALVAQLMPNCPLRTAADIRASVEAFEGGNSPAQISVTTFGWQTPWWAMQRLDDATLVPLFPERVTTRSQDLPALYSPTGAIWWSRASGLRRAGTFHVEGRTGWTLPWHRALDIDTEDDWLLAERLLRSGMPEVAHGL